jgi:Protein of unknown function (DUF1203)
MAMAFRITGLPAEPFSPLFSLSDEALKAHGAVRRIADGSYPCRISLTDSEPGDELLLVNHEHHPVGSPYRMRFAIYVGKARRSSMPSIGFPNNCAAACWRCARSMRMQ